MTTPRRRGLSLVETMIGLSISTLLLTAVAAAFSASSAAMQANDQFFRATQAARVALSLIVNEVRQCQSGSYTGTEVDLFTTAAQHRVYFYNPTEQTLQLRLTDINPPPVYTLAHNVTSAAFNSDGQSLSITLTIRINSNQVTLSASAIPRRTLTYN